MVVVAVVGGRVVVVGLAGSSSSSSEVGSARAFAPSVARMISYTPLLNSSTI